MRHLIFPTLILSALAPPLSYVDASPKHDPRLPPDRSEIQSVGSRFAQNTDLEKLIQDAKKLDVPKKVESSPQSDSPPSSGDDAAQRAKENALEGLEKKLDRDAIRELRDRP